MGLDREELHRHLVEQAGFLYLSATAFDAGSPAEAKRLALTLRNLLHQTGMSHALLGQMLDLPTQQMPNVTSEPAYLDAVVSTGGLYSFGWGETGLELSAKTDIERFTPFTEWWNEPCTVSRSIVITRKSAVIALANQGGGGHVDPREDNNYRTIVEKRELGWIQDTPDGGTTNDVEMNNPLPAIIRAITAEVLHLLADYLSDPRLIIQRVS